MSRMGGVNRLPKERYEYPHCERDFEDQEVRNTWKCPNCGGYIWVYAEDEETATRIILIRKPAKEVVPEDRVHLPGMLTGGSYCVFGISELSNGKLGIGLHGYGQYKVLPNEPVNYRMGSW
ncbi:MAG: hypothetical protein ACXW0M_08870 [Methylosarcina sp.]